MPENIFTRYVRCSFVQDEKRASVSPLSAAEIYYLKTDTIADGSYFPENIINSDDRQRAGRLQNSEYRNFILAGYTFLRRVLAAKTGCRPDEITYRKGDGGKPHIPEDPVFFNISHTRKAFVFSVTENFSSGIDVEELNRKVNYENIVRRFFSSNEVNYILKDQGRSAERFFLLWTRKESLLKLIGTGLIEDLTRLEVFRLLNSIEPQFYSGLREINVPGNIHIYSARVEESFISIALPCRAKITFIRAGRDIFLPGF